jgi:VanZ family protein
MVIFLSLIPSPPDVLDFASSDKLEHLFAYSVLMGWSGQLYVSTRQQILWAVGFCLMGVTLEFVQGWGGYRFFDVADMVANSLGVLLGWWLTRAVFAGFLLRLDQSISRLLE